MDSFQRVTRQSGIFHTGDASGDELSLRSHIAKHFSGSDTGQSDQPPTPQTDKKPKKTFTRPANPSPSVPAGHQLYGLDTELQAGIEPLLPTPSVRYRIMKERIQHERAALETQLQEYQALSNPSNNVREKMKTLRQKLLTLKRHESHVDYKLHQLYGTRSWVFQAVSAWQGFKHQWAHQMHQLGRHLNLQHVLHQVDPKRARLNALNQRLSYLTHVLDDQLSQRTLHADELADVMNQYDRTAKQAETLQSKLSKSGGFLEQILYLLPINIVK